MAIYDADDNILMRFEYADSRLPVAMQSGGATYYLAYDQVGSLRIVTDAADTVIKTLDYDSFGNIIQDSNPTFDMPFGFAGGLYDPDTGLIRFGFREYSPEIGRWTAKDPILFLGRSTDLYGYCLSDPINFFDPDGKISKGALAGLGILGGAALGAGSNLLANLGNINSGMDALKALGSGAAGGAITGLTLVMPKGAPIFGAAAGALITYLNIKVGLIHPCNEKQAIIAGAAGGFVGGLLGLAVSGGTPGIAVVGEILGSTWSNTFVTAIESATGKCIGDALKDLY